MDFKSHLEEAWKMMLKHIAALIFLTLAAAAVSVISFGILAPVALAGYMQAILLLVREDREPKAQDVFSQMGLFLPLLLFGVTVTVLTMLGFALLLLPGVLFLLAVSFFCLYMLPLMSDRGLGLLDAIKESYSMVTRDGINDHVIVFILFAGLSAVGGTVLLGSLFTLPLATLFLMSVYQSLGRAEDESPAETAPSTPEPESDTP
jgi:uncharacterized membrane protein